ncbi:MAG: 50S ribosomal protein L32 [Patescibacteria group bacterium]
MPQEPKKRHSRARQGKRRAAIKLTLTKAVTCPNCSAISRAHMVCKKCGYYDGRKILVINKTTVRRVEKNQPA